MNESTLNVLSKSKIFSGVSHDVINELLAVSTVVELNLEDVLFYQGDISDSVYFLLEGKLLTELITFSGESRVISHIDPGQIVGELGALTNEVRSLTIRASRKSTLIKIPAKNFIDICHRFPTVMFSILRPVVARSRRLLQMISSEKSDKHIVIVPATNGIVLDRFLVNLHGAIENVQGVVVLSDYQPEFLGYESDPERIKANIRLIKEKYGNVRRFLYVLKSHDTALARYAFKKAGKVYIVGDANAPPILDKHIEEKLKSFQHRTSTNPSLILMHPENASQPVGTKRWLQLYPFGIHHHVRLNNVKDYARLLRFMRDRAVGVVLSGGGTRGWAHLGVIKALRETKTPIDMIGGTSVGAVISACYSMNMDFDDAYNKFYQVIVQSHGTVAWRSLTWPIVSLFDAKKYTQAHSDVFGNATIEDLWLPCFGVSSNLATNHEHVHRSGLIWEMTRASTSIPGLIPPMLFNGDIHFDGGLLNNLPVDIMREYLGRKSKIIAVELNSFVPNPQQYNFPPVLTMWQAIKAKFRFGSDKFIFPRFVDIFMQGLFVGSLAKAQENSLTANLLISLNLNKFSLLKSNPEQAKQLIDIGYYETLKQINDTKNNKK